MGVRLTSGILAEAGAQQFGDCGASAGAKQFVV